MIKDGLDIKKLELKGDKLYLGGEELNYVKKLSLDYSKKIVGEHFSEEQYPFFEAEGLIVDENMEPMVKYGEFIEYKIAERVDFVGGVSPEEE